MPSQYGRQIMRSLRYVVLPVAGALLLAPGTALAQDPAPVGGELLGSRGTVVKHTPGLPAFPRGITARGWLIADLDTGDVLAAHDPHGRFAPASTLKVLTALALLPQVPPGRLVRPAFDDVAADGTRVGLVEELSYPADELFASLLMVSGNDAAGALATAVGGMPAATALMNAEAGRLQAHDTRAVNTSGLDAPGQTSSPYDLALIARAGMALPEFRRYVSTRKAHIRAPRRGSIEIYNHNRLLHTYPGALGIKNGFTVAARASFVGAARRGGRTLLVTTMRGNPGVHKEAAALLDWGFAASRSGVQPIGRLVDAAEAADAAPAQGAGAGTSSSPVAAGAGSSPAAEGAAGAAPDASDSTVLIAAVAGVLALAAAAVLHRRRVVLSRRTRRRWS